MRFGAAGVNARPTERSKRGGQPEKRGGARFCGRAMALPYGPGQTVRRAGNREPCRAALCRGRFHIGPVRGGTRPAGGYGTRPYGNTANNRQTGKAAAAPHFYFSAGRALRKTPDARNGRKITP